jgi:hypothetical protein
MRVKYNIFFKARGHVISLKMAFVYNIYGTKAITSKEVRNDLNI